MNKPALGFWQIWNMSFGFLGIQFGWGLQMANMSPIYEYLGAQPHQLPILWLAAPVTGLLVHPIIGQMSDRTWGRLGRRRPYFLIGAILSSLALVLMPNASSIWMAAGLLWILDSAINVSMVPFRAFVADLLPQEQQTRGFAMQSLLIGLGAVVASALPWLLSNLFHVSNLAGADAIAQGGKAIPTTVKISFYLGSVAFLGAVLWTVITTKEHPPKDMAAFKKMKAQPFGFKHQLSEMGRCIMTMPATMRKLAVVQLFTWLGLFCMWLYFPVAVAHNVFGAPQGSAEYTAGVEWGGICFAFYSVVCFAFSFLLPKMADKIGHKWTHILCLLAGAAGLVSVAVIHDKYALLWSMVGVGIAWASILSMPYAILSRCLPEGKVGIYMGIFNFFIVLPEIIAAVGLGWVMTNVLHDNRLSAVVAGGICMVLAAVLMQRVPSAEAAVELPLTKPQRMEPLSSAAK